MMDKNPTYRQLEQQVCELKRTLADRQEAEETLQRYEHIISSTDDLMSFVDSSYIYRAVNTAYLTAHGKQRGEIVGYSIGELMGEEAFHQIVKEKLDSAFNGETVRYQSWFDYPGSGRRFMDVAYHPFVGSHGQINGVVVSAHDITQRKQAEEALRDSKEKYRDLVENIDEVIFTTDEKGYLTYISPRIESWVDIKQSQLTGKSITEFVPPEDIHIVKQQFQNRLAGIIESKEYRVGAEAGTPIWVRSSSRPIYDNGQVIGMRGVLTNITEKKQLEAQLLQAQKMEAVGTLAGGIAHDFNNLLMGIQGYVSLMLMGMNSDHPHYEKVKCIEKSIHSGSGLTRQLLDFARDHHPKIRPVNLNRLINETTKLFGRTIKNITIQKKLHQHLWNSEADQRQIEQVLLNLYINAWQAMTDGGELILRSENVVLQSAFVKPYGVQAGNYVKISVSDSGIGMDKATQERIFDPFFTTKKIGEGTGLGLSSAYGIIQNHDGIINVQSGLNEGATFNIFLPASEMRDIDSNGFEENILKGEETIFLIDDEQGIVDIGESLLNMLGYKVLVACSGTEAMEVYENNHEHIDLVILDLIMPKMSGTNTYKLLKQINPSTPVLLTSGYSFNDTAKQLLEDGCQDFIKKPFTLGELSRKVRFVLDGHPC